MKKLSFLLLDANIVIYAFKLGLWDRLIAQCDVHLARTVMGEAHFYEDERGERRDFELARYEKAGTIAVFDAPLALIRDFLDRFDPTYLERLDPGETESLAYLMNAAADCLICSADNIVYRVLGNLDRAEQGLALEEVLKAVGLGRPLPPQFTKTFRERWTEKGVEERLFGTGTRAPR
jgi:hypothetical protein